MNTDFATIKSIRRLFISSLKKFKSNKQNIKNSE